ncbi:MAG: chromate efflux transporter [Candidatus Thermoplasmatota archaeon]|nr:chromate efflux transporter [Candidatus Thermoplasmatota archaeon]
MSQGRGSRIVELVRLFFKLGFIGFGGPAAHIAMMEEEVVDRRGWMTRQRFLDLVGATHLIPGPNSTEMALHVGFTRAGWPGMLAAGVAFLVPAVSLMVGLAWAYVRYGTLPEVAPWLAGVQAAVVAVIAGALWRLSRTAIDGPGLALLGLAVAGATWLGVSPIVALVGGAGLGTAGLAVRDRVRRAGGAAALLAWLVPDAGWTGLQVAGATTGGPVSLVKLGSFFLKVGAVLYGSGYVLVAFLEGDLVHGYGWLTEQQLLDAVAMGQFTPGPVLTTATFIGFVLAGWPGALIATLAIFLPSFLFVAVLNPWVPRMRASRVMGWFLDAVNAAAVGLMAAVTLRLALGAMTGVGPGLILAGALVAVLVLRVQAVWVVAGGAVAGAVLARLGGLA